MAHLLPPAQYTQYAAAQMLVGIVGIVAHALVPLPLAALVRRHARRHRAAAATGWRSPCSSRWSPGLAAGRSPAGSRRGLRPVARRGRPRARVVRAVHRRARRRAGCRASCGSPATPSPRSLEVALRLAFSAVAVLAGWGPAGALIGFAVGGLVLVARAAGRCCATSRGARRCSREGGPLGRDRRHRAGAVRGVRAGRRGRRAGRPARHGTVAEAGFQALATLAKGPVYVAAGTVLVGFPLLRAGAERRVLRQRAALVRGAGAAGRGGAGHGPARAGAAGTAREYLGVTVAAAVAGRGRAGLRRGDRAGHGAARAARVPPYLLAALPSRCVALPAGLLRRAGRWAGSTGWRLARARRRAGRDAGPGAARRPGCCPPALGRGARRARRPRCCSPRRCSPLAPCPRYGTAVACGRACSCCAPGRASSPAAAPPPGCAAPAAEILHLGFEDPAMPGAGGGSLRTHEINRRLVAAGHALPC